MANLIQATLANSMASPNFLNILVTGLPGAGSTTLYTRLKNEIGVKSRVRTLSESNGTIETPLKLVNDNTYNLEAIQLQETRAVLLHGSTKLKQSSMMYSHCGACQCIIYVVPCGPLDDVYDTIKQNIIAYYALTINVTWIFVINKMDLVDYSEDEYNKCVESIKKIAVKVIGEQRTSKLHFIPMTANDMHTRVTGDDTTLHMTWSNKNTMQLWHVMNQIANESCSEPLKLFRKFKASYIKHKPGTERILSVYVVEGCISVGDGVQILPNNTNKLDTYYLTREYEWGFYKGSFPRVLEIQSFGQSRQLALPNSIVALRLSPGRNPKSKYHQIQYPITPTPYISPQRSMPYGNNWEYNPRYNATILHVGDQTPNYQWKGLLKQTFAGAIHTMGTRYSIKIDRILNIYDRRGNVLDLNKIKEERKDLAIKNGEKADVILSSNIPLNLTYQHPDLNDCCGRFVIQVNYNKIVAVGKIISVYGDKPTTTKK